MRLGDFDTRLGDYLGDHRTTNPRTNFFHNWITTNNAHVWNRSLAFGLPTHQSNLGTSIIDFFISKHDIFSNSPSLVVEELINLNTNHHLLKFTCQLRVHPTPTPPASAPPRRL
jgi:hypothetical protein